MKKELTQTPAFDTVILRFKNAITTVSTPLRCLFYARNLSREWSIRKDDRTFVIVFLSSRRLPVAGSSQKGYNDMNELVFKHDGQILANSRTISSVFNKRHNDVLRAIKALEIPEEIRKRNFALTYNSVQMPNGAHRRDPAVNMTKDGFVLLVMGFTGKKAMEFKIKYIEAFNEMERALSADKPVTVSEHQRALPSGKKEIVLSEKAKQEIGGIVKAVIQANDRPAAPVQDDGIMKAINLLSARMDNMARFMSAGNASAAQRECIHLAELAAQRANDESGRAYSIPMNKEEYDLIAFVRRGAQKNALMLV